MTLWNFRSIIENDYKSYHGIGQVIHEMLCDPSDHHSREDYRAMLEIVRDKLMRFRTDTQRVQSKLDLCQTMEDVGNLVLELNFGEYNEKGIPVSEMVTKRLNEISARNERKRSFFHKVLNIFKG